MIRRSTTKFLDDARLAGVGRATVCRVFTPGGPATPEMNARVRAAAESPDCRPNALTRSLDTTRTQTIGLPVADHDHAFHAEAVERLSLEFQVRRHHVLPFMPTATVDDTDGVVRKIMVRRADGIVPAPVAMSSSLARERAAGGVPVVHFDRQLRVLSTARRNSSSIQARRSQSGVTRLPSGARRKHLPSGRHRS